MNTALVPKTGKRLVLIVLLETQQAINTYPIATLKNSKNPAVAQAFVDYVLSPEGQAVLAKAGFAQP
jgi:molybdate transport system substrate-binding protein